MRLKVAVETFATFHSAWKSTAALLPWHCLFTLPIWLETVARHLGTRGEPFILSVSDGSERLGWLPLSVKDRTASFLGLSDVCDYQDIIARPGTEAAVMAAAAAYMKAQGITSMALQTLRPDALALRALDTLAREDALTLEVLPHTPTYETALPGNWEAYLMQLNGKQRHEVRRKIRRLEAHGPFAYRLMDAAEAPGRGAEEFLRLFRRNRADKADFMDATMAAYFRDLMAGLAREEMLRLYFLDVGDAPAAAVLCFDYGGVRYLYNSGYDSKFQHLGVGVLSKVFSIQKGIEAGCRRYDFLKGAEAYKKRIGGKEVGLYRCKVKL